VAAPHVVAPVAVIRASLADCETRGSQVAPSRHWLGPSRATRRTIEVNALAAVSETLARRMHRSPRRISTGGVVGTPLQ
jgi:hypothetical protein